MHRFALFGAHVLVLDVSTVFLHTIATNPTGTSDATSPTGASSLSLNSWIGANNIGDCIYNCMLMVWAPK
jgi:hypothetical protein